MSIKWPSTAPSGTNDEVQGRNHGPNYGESFGHANELGVLEMRLTNMIWVVMYG